MTKAAIIGYASIDYPAVLDGFFRGDETVLIKERPADAFPRPGGCPLYVAVPIAEAGLPVSIITWVGDDSLGDLFYRSRKTKKHRYGKYRHRRQGRDTHMLSSIPGRR